MIELKNRFGDTSLSLSDKDKDEDVEIMYFDDPDYSIWVNKDQAIQIINHLKEQFEL